MENTVPTTAYDLLDTNERHVVDNYVQYAVDEQHRKRERIAHALYLPIPSEYIRRSKSMLYKPLLRAAVAERIRVLAHEQDISPDKVTHEHASIAFSDITDYIEDAGFGQFKVKDIGSMPRSKTSAIKSIETKPGMYGLATKIVLHDKHPSLKALGEMMGIVSPDKPIPLKEYIAPPSSIEEKRDVPEDIYMKLLEAT